MEQTLKLAAKAGDPNAIAQLIAQALRSKKITARAVRTDTKLVILLSAEETPAHSQADFIKKGLAKIQPQGIKTVAVRAQNASSTRIAWAKQWYLLQPTQSPQPHSSPASPEASTIAPSAQPISRDQDVTSHSSALGQIAPLAGDVAQPADTGIWRDKNLLVMRRGAQLPDRCIKTNQPAQGKRYQAELRWLPWWYIFLGAISLFAAIFLSHRATLSVGMTERQLKKYKQSAFVGWILTALGVILCIAPLALPIDKYPEWVKWILILGLILLLIGPVISLIVARPVSIATIRGDFIWLRGVSKPYLNRLPEWQPARQQQAIKATVAQSIKPWHRWEARLFDSFISCLLAVVLLDIFWPSVIELTFSNQAHDIAFTAIILLLHAVLFEPILLCSWGTTPGKALLRIQVRQRNGQKLSYLQAVNRSLSVGVGGMALGIHPISLFTMLSGYRQLTTKGITTWDRVGGFTVSHQKVSVLRRSVIAALIGLFVFLGVVGTIVEESGYANHSIAQESIVNGDNFLNAAQYQDALEAYDDAIEIGANDAVTWGNRGFALHGLEQYEEALISYDKSIKIDANDALAWNARGNVLSDLGRYEEAVASYDRAIELEPHNAFIWTHRGLALGVLGKHEQALASLKTALDQDRNDAFIWFAHSNLLYKMGKYAEAQSAYQRAISLEPSLIDEINKVNGL
ncbi:tetratricopeptide repeat protein [Leptothoe spongobia]|uniref:Tetratricopeptide repeat protein n=1 Tax=Leptothoe spongobia TAU-MAC 1115 TaxID=1967444 RepID=A0A947DK13_9CYAN|nr:tetratricopeptide repeat protein [Leptothoe spongobia]MBT9317670.1 tetratricopeptide repeat protein [Leptothoe spongobia TAU-MAC 1115]